MNPLQFIKFQETILILIVERHYRKKTGLKISSKIIGPHRPNKMFLLIYLKKEITLNTINIL